MRDLKHAQVRAELLPLLEEDLRPNERLPTERELAETFNVSRVTVRRALQQLEFEGRVYRIQGSGTFVAARPIAKTIELTSFTEDMRKRGLQPGSRLLSCEIRSAGGELGMILGLSPTEMLVHIERLRTADGVPMCIDSSFLPAGRFPGLQDHRYEGSLYELLEHRYHARIEWADQTVRASVLAEREARLLGVPAFSPALMVERTGYDQRGAAIERGISLYRGDRYSYQMRIVRAGPAVEDDSIHDRRLSARGAQEDNDD